MRSVVALASLLAIGAAHDKEKRTMLVLGMLFGVLVAGPLLVLGALAFANSERTMAWIGGGRRRWLPSSARAATPGGSPSGQRQVEATESAAPVDGAAARSTRPAPGDVVTPGRAIVKAV